MSHPWVWVVLSTLSHNPGSGSSYVQCPTPGSGSSYVQPDVLFVRSQVCVFPTRDRSVGFISKHMSFLFPTIVVRGLHCDKYTLPAPTQCQQEKQKAPPHSSTPSCANKDAGIYSCRVSAWAWSGKMKMQKRKKSSFTNQFHEYSPLRKLCPFKNNLTRRTASLPKHRHSQNIVTPRVW